MSYKTKSRMKNTIFITKILDDITEAKTTVIKDNTSLTVGDIAMDSKLVKDLSNSWVFISYKNVPKSVGWYKLDDKTRSFCGITERQADRLPPEKVLLVTESAIKDMSKGKPLVLAVSRCIEGLVLIGGFDLDSAKAAPNETGRKVAGHLLNILFLRSDIGESANNANTSV